MNNTILAIFSDRMNAEGAISDLEMKGFNPKDISLIMKDQTPEKKVHHHGTNVAEGAASGLVTGGVLGGLAGLLIGVGAITLPGIGGLLVAGPIAAALGLAGAAATTVSGAITGAVAGGVVGSLVGLGVPEEEAKVYENKIREGGILLAIPTLFEEEGTVREILTKHNADMIRAVTAQRYERDVYARSYSDYVQADQPRYDQPRYEQSRYDEQYAPDAVYYSDVPRTAPKEYYRDEPRPDLADTETGPESEEDARNTAHSLKEKLKKLFS